MAGRKYDKLKIEDFGVHLIKTGDLDPIYYALHALELGALQKHRWLLAYWCFYNAGIACYLSERTKANYWEAFRIAAANVEKCPAYPTATNNGGWPRGKERRHFRGMQAVMATQELEDKYPVPEYAFNHLVRPEDPSRIPFSVISARVQTWRGFGQWISFKVGDMIDRCAINPVDFAFDEAMYVDPTKAALMQWKVWHGVPQESTIDNEKAAVQEVVDRLIVHFGSLGFLAPPLNDRPIGLQEVETILCKWKSHLGGHYGLNNDLHEIHDGVKPWLLLSETARRFSGALPPIPV